MFAPEGLAYLVVPAVLFFALALLAVVRKRVLYFVLSGLMLLVWIAMLLFFRDPVRALPPEGAIVSPADGVIVKHDTDSLGVTHVAIFLALTDVHAIRAPIQGGVRDYRFVPGEFLRADHPEAGERNQYAALVIETPFGEVEMRAISGVIARRVLVHSRPGDALFPGERIGFVRFGSRCELWFPPGFIPSFQMGDRVFGGITTLGRFQEIETEPDSMKVLADEEIRA